MPRIYKRHVVLHGGWAIWQPIISNKPYWLSTLPAYVYLYCDGTDYVPPGVVLCERVNVEIAIMVARDVATLRFEAAQLHIKRKDWGHGNVIPNPVTYLGPSSARVRGSFAPRAATKFSSEKLA